MPRSHARPERSGARLLIWDEEHCGVGKASSRYSQPCVLEGAAAHTTSGQPQSGS